QFVTHILDEKRNRRFLAHFREFQRKISHYGLFNSLSQTLLKIAAPGVPDFYQGTELWDFSLVDPDNRRPVDYERRRHLLEELRARVKACENDSASPGNRPHPLTRSPSLTQLARDLVQTKEDGRIKLFVTHRGLHCRRDHPGLFTQGEYLPATAVG